MNLEGDDKRNAATLSGCRHFLFCKAHFISFNVQKTPPPGIEPGSPKGTGLKPVAIPLCDGGLKFLSKHFLKIHVIEIF